jgi:hypothetical protein
LRSLIQTVGMKFLYPDFLWALSFIAIPVIVHLFNFRKFQKVFFSNVGLLKEVQLQTKSKSQLKHLILLMVRILFIIVLVFAFAQPYFPDQNLTPPGDHHVSIFIDNSHSMDSKGENGYRLDLAKEHAVEIIKSYGPSDVFQLITNNFEGKHQRFYNKTEAIQLVEEIQPSYYSKKLSDVFLRQQEMMNDVTSQKILYWLSDFQKHQSDLGDIKVDSTLRIVGLPYPHATAHNVYIDSIWFDTPVRRVGVEDKVWVRVINQTPTGIEFKLQLKSNDDLLAFINFEIDAGQTRAFEVPFTLKKTGLQHASVTISDYPDADLLFDDTYYFSYTVLPVIKVLHIYEGSEPESTKYLNSLFGSNDYFEFQSTSLSSADFGSVNQFNFIILSDLSTISSGLSTSLQNYLTNQGHVLVFPGTQADPVSYTSFVSSVTSVSLKSSVALSTKVKNINTEHPIYQDLFDVLPQNVDLPGVSSYYPITLTTGSGMVTLMELQNGLPFLAYKRLAQGSLAICASPLTMTATTFPKHALFVPTLLRLAEFSQAQGNYAYVIGKDNSLPLSVPLKNSDQLMVESSLSDAQFKPEVQATNSQTTLLIYDQIDKAGHYTLRQNEEVLTGFSFNYDRNESNQSFYSMEELTEELSSSQLVNQFTLLASVDSSNSLEINTLLNTNKYWKWLIVACLLLLLAEIAIYRLWK